MSGATSIRPTEEKDTLGDVPSHSDQSVEFQRTLRRVYGTCFAEDVPERFVKLLAQLREQDIKS